MNNIKVSVIMPVFNTGELLKESIEAILNQSLKEIELICVDDASNDEITRKILKSYEKADKRLTNIFLLENKGAGNARNEGFKAARGEYVLFFDSDDYAIPEMVEKMYDLCVKNQLDFCTCESYTVDVLSRGLISSISYRQVKGITDRPFSAVELGENALSFWDTAPWNKLVLRSFLIEYGIEFQNISTCNDVYYTVMCALRARRIMYCDPGKPLVEYRMGRKSQISLNKNPRNLILAFQKLFRDTGEDNETIRQMLISELVFLARGEIYSSSNDLARRELYQYVKMNVCDQHNSTPEKEFYYALFRNESFDSRWFQNDNPKEADIIGIEKNIDCSIPVIIWGYGRYGIEIEKYLKEKEKYSVFVADRKNILIGGRTAYGTEIISTETALSMNANIVSTKEEINDYLNNIISSRPETMSKLVRFMYAE